MGQIQDVTAGAQLQDDPIVLAALKKDPTRAAVRFSFNGENTEEEIDYVVAKLAEVLKVAADRVKTA